ncbi:MAG: hypothetical protein EHM71_16670, partial [Zetaproteobacteria bacterium]
MCIGIGEVAHVVAGDLGLHVRIDQEPLVTGVFGHDCQPPSGVPGCRTLGPHEPDKDLLAEGPGHAGRIVERGCELGGTLHQHLDPQVAVSPRGTEGHQLGERQRE